jgi:siroheme synthase
VIENGTLGTQRQAVTRLGALSSAGFRGPALIVIGPVVGLARTATQEKAKAA